MLLDTHHIFHFLNHWCAEVDRKIHVIVVTSCMPAFNPVILVLCLVFMQRSDPDRVEVVEVAVDGVIYLAWLDLFRVCCEGRTGEEEEEGGGELMAHDHLGK